MNRGADLGAVAREPVFSRAIRIWGPTFAEEMMSSELRSQIRDTDFRKETSELTRAQIIQPGEHNYLSRQNQRLKLALSLLQAKIINH